MHLSEQLLLHSGLHQVPWSNCSSWWSAERRHQVGSRRREFRPLCKGGRGTRGVVAAAAVRATLPRQHARPPAACRLPPAACRLLPAAAGKRPRHMPTAPPRRRAGRRAGRRSSRHPLQPGGPPRRPPPAPCRRSESRQAGGHGGRGPSFPSSPAAPPARPARPHPPAQERPHAQAAAWEWRGVVWRAGWAGRGRAGRGEEAPPPALQGRQYPRGAVIPWPPSRGGGGVPGHAGRGRWGMGSRT